MANMMEHGNIITLEQARAEKCLAEIKRILQVNNCHILPQTVIVGNQIVQSGYVVVANPAVPQDLRGEKGNG